MNYPEILKQAWAMTTEHRYLRILGTIASLFATLLGIWRIRYVLQEPVLTGGEVWSWLQENTNNPLGWAITIVIVLGAIYLVAFLLSVLSEGGLISDIEKIYDQKVELDLSKTIALGLQSFLPLTEFRVLSNIFHIGAFILYVLIFRFYINYFFPNNTIVQDLSPLLIFLAVVIAVTTLLLTYADYHLVIYKSSVFESIRKSVTLVIFHFRETLLMSVLILLVAIKTILNVLLIFAIPALAVYVVTFTQLFLPATIALAIGITFAVMLFYWAVVIVGTLLVFTTAVWTLTFMELEKKQEHKILKNEPDIIPYGPSEPTETS